MKATRPVENEHTLAVFIDFENLALGFNSRRDRFNVEKILERLVEKGKIVVKRAYCDWSRFGNYTGPLHESAIELIEIPKRAASGKNSADIRLVVDAMDLAYSKDHIDTFVIVSGDSDFSPLVSKLKELGKHVIGLGLVDATSHLLRDNCDEFIYYEDLARSRPTLPTGDGQLPEAKQKLYELLMDSLVALRREGKDAIYSSMVKDTMKRKKPSFNEEYHGYRTFSELLEDAQQAGLLDLEKAKTSGTYVVTRFGTEPKVPPKAERSDRSTERRPPPSDRSTTSRPVLTPNAPLAPSDRSTTSQPPVATSDRSTTGRPPAAPSDRSTDRRPAPSDRSTERRPPTPVTPPVVVPREPVSREDGRDDRRRHSDQPERPAIKPAPRPADDDDRTFGRALIEDLEPIDDIPSYQPRRGPVKPDPVEPPAVKPVVKPVPRAAAKPVEKPAPKPVEKPAAKPVEKPAPRVAKPAEKPVEKPAAPPRRRSAEAPAKPKPAPNPPADDDGFGAGLELDE